MEPCDILAFTPGCVAGHLVGSASSGVLDAIGNAFAGAAESVMNAVFDAIVTTTTVDLTASYVTSNAAALGSVALVLVVGLFVIQVITAGIRREPGGLGRAVTGAGFAVLGTAAAATVVQSLLVVIDGLCDGIAGLAGTSIQDAARRLLDATLLMKLTQVGGGGSALMIVFGLLFIAGAVLTLGTLLVRQALIVIAVVVAPLALAGGTARITTGWVRRWAQVTLALILSKLAIVIVFVVAVGMVGDGEGIGALLSGLILLLLAALAPWACFKVLDFAGTHIAAEWHRATNGASIAVANQGRFTAQSLMRTVAPIVGGATAGPAGVAAAGAATSGGPGPGSGPGAAGPRHTAPSSPTAAGGTSTSATSTSSGPGPGPTPQPAPAGPAAPLVAPAAVAPSPPPLIAPSPAPTSTPLGRS